MFEILGLYGIPQPILDAIRLMYTNNTSTVLSPDGETAPIDIKAGILQGDTLAPFLFIMVVDYVLRMSLDLSRIKVLRSNQRSAHVIQLSILQILILPMTFRLSAAPLRMLKIS